MPKIFLAVPQDEFSVEDIRTNPQAVCQRLHELVKLEVEEHLADPEAYVVDYDGDMIGHILGAVEPEQLRSAAAEWNSNIRRNLLLAIGQLIEDVGQMGVAATNSNTLWLDSATTYNLKKAALAADNCFFDFAEDILNLPNDMGYTYLSAIISDQQLAAIMAAPEQYAILPIWVK